MTEKEIINILCIHKNSPVSLRKNYLAIPNLSWGFFSWGEADLIVISNNYYLTEIEIKISYNDWLADEGKKKYSGVAKSKRLEEIKYFYYCVPLELLQKGIPDFVEPATGIIVIEKGKPKVHRYAQANPLARKMFIDDLLKLARLACFRLFS